MNDDLRGARQRVNDRMAELLKNAQGALSYKSYLSELQTTVEQIRVLLLVPQATLRASQSQLHVVSQWAATFSQTR